MNGKAQIWADQTLNTGVLQGLPRDTLSETARLLSKAGADLFDLQLSAWHRYPEREAEVAFAGQVRSIIDANVQQVESACQAGFNSLLLTYTFQRWRSIEQDLAEVLSAGRNKGLSLSLHVVNASEAEAQMIKAFFPILQRYSVKSLIIGDRDSRLDPLQTFELIGNLRGDAPCLLGFHAHNSYGLATANAYAAMRAGAAELAVAAAGIGCCGHAALEEVLLAGRCIGGQELAISGTLAADITTVLAYLGYDTPANKAVIGQAIFSHESGIHVNGIGKDHRLYEAFPPELVGLSRRVVIGKHSGTTSLKAKFEEWGLPLEARVAKQLLAKIRRLAVAKKNIVEDMQLKRLYYRMIRRSHMRISSAKGGLRA